VVAPNPFGQCKSGYIWRYWWKPWWMFGDSLDIYSHMLYNNSVGFLNVVMVTELLNGNSSQ
jgi:hypothetical protein